MMPTGIELRDLRLLVIRPVTISLGLGGDAAEELLLGTALQESGSGRSLDQNGGGPGLGVWQMEPATHDDIWGNFLGFHPQLGNRVLTWTFSAIPKAVQMIGNLYYACAMARVQYYRSSLALPQAGDLAGQAAMWKAVYNTPAGAGTVEQFKANAQGVLNV